MDGSAASAKALASAAVAFELAASLGFRDGEACLADCAYRQALVYQRIGRSKEAIERVRAAADHYDRAADGYRRDGRLELEAEIRSNYRSCLDFIEQARTPAVAPRAPNGASD